MDLSQDLVQDFISLFWIALSAVVAAMMASATRRKVPDVVWLLGFGMLIGPSGLALADDGGGIALLKDLGLGFLFLMAGFHIKRGSLSGKPGAWGMSLWIVSALAAFGLMLFLVPDDPQKTTTAIVFAIALTSTALGTLLPILKDSGEVHAPLGKAVILHGAVGELSPIIAMSFLLSSRNADISAVVLLVFAALGVVFAVLPKRVVARVPKLGKMIVDGMHTTASTTLRMIFFVLTGLLVLSAILELDIVLGAFAAGVIVRSLVPDVQVEETEEKLSHIGYSFLIPGFFVCSGMIIDWRAVTAKPLEIIGLVVIILVLRGGPVFVAELTGRTGSGLETTRDKVRLALFASTGLPIIVAVTGVARNNNLIGAQMASIMVLAGAVTVLVFPAVAGALSGTRAVSLDESAARVLIREAATRRAKEQSEEELNHSERLLEDTIDVLHNVARGLRSKGESEKIAEAEAAAAHIEGMIEDAKRELWERQVLASDGEQGDSDAGDEQGKSAAAAVVHKDHRELN